MGRKMRFLGVTIAMASALMISEAALAQDTSVTQAVTPPPQATTSGDPDSATAGDAQDTLLSEAELEQLVAPIALYPDPLLANALIASTYPLEIVQAERWYQQNKDLKGDALQEALADQDWDDSIKDLVSVPDALEMMNKDLDWTQKLGDAVLAQQSDVMNAVQALRARAKANGTLESNPQQTVSVTQTLVQNGGREGASTQGAPPQEVIAIQPTDPEKIYVPYYEPAVAYGAWPYPSYQPYYFPPPPGYRFGSALATGLAWSAGFAIGNAIWGDDINWGRNDINVNVNRNISGNTINRNNLNVQKWEHNSEHRRGVQYNNTEVRNKFDSKGNRNNVANQVGDNAGNRRPGDGKGRPTVGDLKADLKKPGSGNGRPGNLAGDKRPGVGSGRPSVGDIEAGLKKPGGGGGNRPAAGPGDRPKVGGGGSKAGVGNRPGGGAQANLRDKPAAKKPSVNKPSASKTAARKPQSRPSGNAFEKRDGAAERKASARGRASAGGRSISRGHGGGGRRAGGGRRR